MDGYDSKIEQLGIRHTVSMKSTKINTTDAADFQKTNKENIYQNLPFGNSDWLYKSSAIFKRVI